MRLPPVFLAICMCMSIPAFPQSPEIKNPEEAPLSLFELNIGDADVDFFILGSWALSLYFTSGLTVKPNGGITILDSFPDMPTGLYFNQLPDLSFSVRVMKKYFFELDYTGNFELNRFKGGYEGEEGEFVQHVFFGNKDIGLAGYKFMNVPQSSYSSLGASALFATENTRHEAMVRYESNTQSKKVFVGQNEADEYVLHPEEYALGRYFKLPDGNIENPDVFIQDRYGTFSGADGRKYKQAGIDDVSIDQVAGTLWIKTPFESRILVYYTKDAFEIGDPAIGIGAIVNEDAAVPLPNIDLLGSRDFYFDMPGTVFGEDMNDREISLSNGKNCLLLWEPGVFSPFEISGAYLLPQKLPEETWRVKIFPVIKGSTIEKTGTGVSFRSIPNENRFIAYFDQAIRTNFRNLYPFPDDVRHTIYGPSRVREPSSTDFDIIAQVLTPVTEYYLEAKLVPGSVRVTRNGVEETRFDVDYNSGKLTFKTPIHPEDRLEITYGKNMSLFDSGDLLFAWGNRIKLNDLLTLEASTGLRWNMLPGSYTETAYSRTGSVNGSVSLSGKNDSIAFDLSAGGSLANPDTTGTFRLLDMEYADYPVSISQETGVPASPPVGSYTQADRGRLFYKDYRQYGVLGDSILNSITWPVPADQVFPYANFSKPGPYEVADKASPLSYSSLVMDFSISTGETWVGMQIPIVRGAGVADLSGVDSISVSYKPLDISAPVTMYIELGETAEDIDGDSVLDYEPSASSSGFVFNDSIHAVNLYIGSGPKNQGNARIDTEDVDANGFLDPENPNRIVTIGPINLLAGSSPWNLSYHLFSEAEKKILTRCRSIRIYIADSGSNSTGKVLVDKITISGSSFWKELTGIGTGTVVVREINEAYAIVPAPVPLQAKYPVVASTFHSGGEEQKVLEVSWSGVAPTDGWIATNRFLPSAGGIQYSDVIYYTRQSSVTGSGTVTCTLADSLGRRVRWTYISNSIASWTEMRLSMDTATLLADGSAVAGSSVLIEPGYDYSPVLFSIEVTGEPDGYLYIDELYLTNPALSLGVAFEGNFAIALAGELVKAGDVTILSDLIFSQKMLYSSQGYAPLYGKPEGGNLFSSVTDLSANILYSNLDTHVDLKGTDDAFFVSPRHSLRIPAAESVVNFTDVYGVTETLSGSQLARENTIAVKPVGELIVLRAGTRASSHDSILVQGWSGSLSSISEKIASSSLSVDYSESKNGYVFSDDFYLYTWIRDFRYILPFVEGGPVEEKGTALFKGSVLTTPIGMTLDAAIGFHDYNFTGITRSAQNTIDYGFSIPVSIAPDQARSMLFTLGYKRHFETSTSPNGPGSLGSDLEEWGRAISGNTYIFNQVPLYECFDPALVSLFIDASYDHPSQKAIYKPEIFGNFTKQAGSSIWDLLLPSQAELSFARFFGMEGGLFDFKNILKVSLTNSAINLFGKIGSYPIFGFYISDEYTLTFLANIEFKPEKIKSDYILDGYFIFRGQKQDALTLSSQLKIETDTSYRLTDRSSIVFDWGVYPAKGVQLPIVSETVGATGFWQNREECTVTISDYGLVQSLHPVTIIVTHSTGISYPDTGYIRALVSVGIDFERIQLVTVLENYTRLVFKAGLEAQFKW